MSADPNKKSARTFQCRDVLWETFEQMARELECSVDYLVNEAMKQYARQRSYGASRTPHPSSGRGIEAQPPAAAPAAPPSPMPSSPKLPGGLPPPGRLPPPPTPARQPPRCRRRAARFPFRLRRAGRPRPRCRRFRARLRRRRCRARAASRRRSPWGHEQALARSQHERVARPRSPHAALQRRAPLGH